MGRQVNMFINMVFVATVVEHWLEIFQTSGKYSETDHISSEEKKIIQYI